MTKKKTTSKRVPTEPAEPTQTPLQLPKPKTVQQPADVAPESLNRSAFFLGLYVELTAVDSIVEPLLQLSWGSVSITRVLLLDSALARLGAYDAELSFFPPQENVGLDAAEDRRRSTLNFLCYVEREKIKKIAGLLFPQQTEVVAWFKTGKAVGVIVNACDDGGIRPTPQMVAIARSCLNQAVSYWSREPMPENGSGLIDWLAQWPDQIEATDTAAVELDSPAFKGGAALQSEDTNRQLRIVEGLAEQIRDRADDSRPEEQRLRDERDQFIYGKFQAGCDASQVRTLTNNKIDEEKLKWPRVSSQTDVRSIADLYAKNFDMGRPPSGKTGRPRKNPK